MSIFLRIFCVPYTHTSIQICFVCFKFLLLIHYYLHSIYLMHSSIEISTASFVSILISNCSKKISYLRLDLFCCICFWIHKFAFIGKLRLINDLMLSLCNPYAIHCLLSSCFCVFCFCAIHSTLSNEFAVRVNGHKLFSCSNKCSTPMWMTFSCLMLTICNSIHLAVFGSYFSNVYFQWKLWCGYRCYSLDLSVLALWFSNSH